MRRCASGHSSLTSARGAPRSMALAESCRATTWSEPSGLSRGPLSVPSTASASASSVPPQRNLGARRRREAFGERGAPVTRATRCAEPAMGKEGWRVVAPMARPTWARSSARRSTSRESSSYAAAPCASIFSPSAVAVKARMMAYRPSRLASMSATTGPTRSSCAGPTWTAPRSSPSTPCASKRGLPFPCSERRPVTSPLGARAESAPGSTFSAENWRSQTGLFSKVAVTFAPIRPPPASSLRSRPAVFPSLFRSASPRTGPARSAPARTRSRSCGSTTRSRSRTSPACRPRSQEPLAATPLPPSFRRSARRPTVPVAAVPSSRTSSSSRIGAQLGSHGDGAGAQLQVAHVDPPFERSPAGLGRLARLDCALERGLGGPADLRNLDPGLLQPGLGDDDPVRLERQRLDPDARALRAEHAVALRVAQVHAVHADAEEAADVDGADPQVSLDGVARLVGDVAPQLLGAPAGVQPDEPRHDGQQEKAEQREDADPENAHSAALSPSRLQSRRRRLVA